MRTALLALALLLTGLPSAAAQDADADTQLVIEKLAAGWTYLEAGALGKAEEAFTSAFETRAGKDRADVYYSIAAVWWERRNAAAAHWWLNQAESARKVSWYWDGGEDGEWDRRIGGRIRYIERNFTVVKLRGPNSGKPLPPLADPPPGDPMLRSFTDALAAQVSSGAEAGASVQWFFLPNGVYYTAGEELVLENGEMDSGRAESWQLPADRGVARKRYDDRVAAIAAEEAEQERLAAERMAARERAWKAQRDGSTGQTQPAVTAQTQTSDSPGETPAVVALPLTIDPDQRPIARRLVTWDSSREVSADLSARWRSAGFHARYGVTCPNDESKHEIDFADADFYVRFGPAGALQVRGAERLNEKLRGDWLCGERGELNLVELWYDARKLLVVVNGVEFGPVTVRRDADEVPVGRWAITLTDPRAEIQHLWIEPWDAQR